MSFKSIVWQWNPSEHPELEPIKIEMAKQMDGTTKFAVRHSGACLNKSGQWEFEPMPSSRDEAFFERCRYDSWDDAANQIINKSDRYGEIYQASARGGKQMIKATVTRYYQVPIALSAPILRQSIRLMNQVNSKKCNGMNRGRVKLSGFCGEQIGNLIHMEVSYCVADSSNVRCGSKSFPVYPFGDIRKIFKRLAPYRAASAQKAESK